MFITALFTIARTWKRPRCPSADAWIRKLWYVYTTEFRSVQSLTCVRLFMTPSTTALQASLAITNCQSPPKPMSIKSVMPSNHLILCRPLLLLPSIFPSIRICYSAIKKNASESLLKRWMKLEPIIE